ncbi:MAG: hypothetical protein ABSF71_32290 [Terriglobia bacterium]|jgi:hypothetical protein
MRQVKSTVCLGLLFLSFGIATSPALGGDDKNQANWDKLKQLSAGQEIQVVQNDAKSSRSTFRSVTDEAIVVSTATGEQTVSRQNILRVSSKEKGYRKRNALIGAGIGAGAGLGIGAIMDAHDKCSQGVFCLNILPNGGKEIVTPLGAIVGAIIGTVLPTGGWHEIYRAR